MKHSDDLKLVFTGNPIDADIVNQILQDNDIETLVRNEHIGTIAPWHASPGGIDPIDIFVLSENAEKAMELINEFLKK